MADLKISQLTGGNPAQSADLIPVARNVSGIETNFSITAGSIVSSTGGTFYINNYSGTPGVKFQACEAAARAVAGICDASGLNGTVVFPETTGLTIGDTNGDPVTIIWPGNGTVWQFPNLTGGTNAMLTQYVGTSAFGVGVTENAFTMQLNSVANGALCGYQVLNGSVSFGYWRMEGVYFQQHGLGVASGIFVNIAAGEDQSGLRHSAVFDSSATDTAIVALTATGSSAGFCCAAALSDVLIDGNYVGGIPLAVYGITGGKQPNGFDIHNVTIQHPKPGLAQFFCQDTSSQPKVDITFSGASYWEASQDTTTAMFQNDGCRRISIPGGVVVHAEATNTAKTVFTSTNRFNTLWEIGPTSLISGNGNWTLPAVVMNNSFTGEVLSSDSNGFFGGYSNGPNYMSNIQVSPPANVTFLTTTSGASTVLHGFDSGSGTGAAALDIAPIGLTNQSSTIRLFRQSNSGTANSSFQVFNGDGTSGTNAQIAGLNGNTYFNANNTTGSFSIGATSCGGLSEFCVGASNQFKVTSAGNVSTTGHINTTSANNDIVGTITITSGTAQSYTFATPYTNPPVCVLTPQSDTTSTGAWWVTTGNTIVTAHTSIMGTTSFFYHCVGAPS